MSDFTEVRPTLENYWRSIILFGRNVASYKFALGKSLLELAPKGQELIPLTDLAEPFSRNICEHLQVADKQATSAQSQFLDACRSFNSGTMTQDELVGTTTKRGFVNVIDAFHVVHDGEIGTRFFQDERRGTTKGIRLTDELLELAELCQFRDLGSEVEARWRLVETAWELNLPSRVLSVDYQEKGDLLVVGNQEFERKAITSCRDALNGYQKGKCFYCFDDISIVAGVEQFADVDHYFPHTLKPHGFGDTVDGVWNLVLSCRICNRGPNGKFALLPKIRFLNRLHTRNNFYIQSHHPLRETLMQQTGVSEKERIAFLQQRYQEAKEILVKNWEPEFEHEAAF